MNPRRQRLLAAALEILAECDPYVLAEDVLSARIRLRLPDTTSAELATALSDLLSKQAVRAETNPVTGRIRWGATAQTRAVLAALEE